MLAEPKDEYLELLEQKIQDKTAQLPSTETQPTYALLYFPQPYQKISSTLNVCYFDKLFFLRVGKGEYSLIVQCSYIVKMSTFPYI